MTRTARSAAASILLSVLVLLGLQVPAAGPASAADCTQVQSIFGQAPFGDNPYGLRVYDVSVTVRLDTTRCSGVEYRAEISNGDRVVGTLDSRGKVSRVSSHVPLGTVRTSPTTGEVLYVTVRPYSPTYGMQWDAATWVVGVPNSGYDTANKTNSCPVSSPLGYTRPC